MIMQKYNIFWYKQNAAEELYFFFRCIKLLCIKHSHRYDAQK